jgi:quercetin dioxygenase-like cupin family protein
MEIKRGGSQPSRKGPGETFTGTVRVDPLFAAQDPSRTSGGGVTFEPGERSAWHTHPRGQILIVIAGSGWVQRWEGLRHDMKPGDVVWIPPGVKHWRGRDHGGDARRDPGARGRQGRRLAGEGQRRAVRAIVTNVALG